VWLTKRFADGDPVLLLLGDFVYRSGINESCSKQIIDAYKECGRTLVSIMEIPAERVVHYGILHGVWDENESLMKVDAMVEKPTDDYAREYLGVRNNRGEKKYYATFGQYVLTQEVYDELEREINSGNPTEGAEFGLTAALDRVREKHGMFGFVPKGRSFDIGLPDAYQETMLEYGRVPAVNEG
jgi:UTP-glucose-1-phosphate uridylyltransferase